MVTSGLRIFRAFPSFGPKIPEQVLLTIPRYVTLGGWLGGALQWHFTFIGSCRQRRAVCGVSVFRATIAPCCSCSRCGPACGRCQTLFFLGPNRRRRAIQPAAKAGLHLTIGFGVLSLLTGLVLFKPHSFLGWRFYSEGFTSPASGTSPRCAVPRLHPRSPDHGSAAWLVEFLLHAFRLETRTRVPGVAKNR